VEEGEKPSLCRNCKFEVQFDRTSQVADLNANQTQQVFSSKETVF
jgi:hypothetical protein